MLPASWLLGVLASVGAIAAVRLSRAPIALLLLPTLTLLPWLGVGWPVFLMWSGHLVLLLWALVAAGVTLAYSSSLPRLPSRFGAVTLAAGALIAAFALGASRSPLTGDAPHRRRQRGVGRRGLACPAVAIPRAKLRGVSRWTCSGDHGGRATDADQGRTRCASVTVRLARGAWHQTISIAARGRGSIDVPGAPRVERMDLDVIGGERQRSAVFVSARARAGGQ